MQAATGPVKHPIRNNLRNNGYLQSNSTSTLYVNNTISCPDADELLYWLVQFNEKKQGIRS